MHVMRISAVLQDELDVIGKSPPARYNLPLSSIVGQP
jgi:hypothetical protein